MRPTAFSGKCSITPGKRTLFRKSRYGRTEDGKLAADTLKDPSKNLVNGWHVPRFE